MQRYCQEVINCTNFKAFEKKMPFLETRVALLGGKSMSPNSEQSGMSRLGTQATETLRQQSDPAVLRPEARSATWGGHCCRPGTDGASAAPARPGESACARRRRHRDPSAGAAAGARGAVSSRVPSPAQPACGAAAAAVSVSGPPPRPPSSAGRPGLSARGRDRPPALLLPTDWPSPPHLDNSVHDWKKR